MNNAVATEPPATSIPETLPTDTSVPTEAATEVIAPMVEATATEALPTATATVVMPQTPTLGGADKIAFVANKEIHIMNVDGSELKPTVV
jgi:hypothetical protein